MTVYKSVIEFIKKADPSEGPSILLPWSRKLSHLLETHPYLANESSDEEDSQEVGGNTPEDPDVDFSLSSSEGEEEEEEEEGAVGGVVIPEKTKNTRSVAVRKKPKVCCVVQG